MPDRETTPTGRQVPKAYEPSQYEDAIYKSWEESGFFNPDNLEGEPWSVMMPPPNVTGVLHLGHALENSLMDTMVRYQRMRGKKVLLLPGTDHAAIATQAKVEKLLMAEGIKNPRETLGREELLKRVRKFSEESKATILQQIKKLGTSCDWSRLAYTFDEERNRAVNEVFVKMYHDGLIYRGFRVVNWSVKGQSTCSDDELVHVERPAKLYYFSYSKDFPIMIATTRPETKLGDTAVAINPGDVRYKHLLGQTVSVEVGAKEPLAIKIIADDNVEMEYGTGALGVTPAHSAVDYEMYVRQKAAGNPIGFVQVINEQGRMTEAAGQGYAGLTTIEAREKFVAWLDAQGLLEKTEDISQNVGTSDRFGDVVEALPMTQWFIDVNKVVPGRNKTMKELMVEAVTIGHNNDANQKITITPERFQRSYLHWIDNLHDWCISRQIWWGHRIPVWYRGDEMYCGHQAPEGDNWTQDEDTLDTWFSSGLWTFSTLGYPAETKDLQQFHPTDWMQMGYEILFFWMARMILMTTYALDTIPFRDVYIHGILRDENNKKFSKSSGNNIDPLEVIEQFGTDALRLSVMTGIAPGNDSKYYVEKVEAGRNLVNKIWNISRFVSTAYEFKNFSIDNFSVSDPGMTEADRWICQKFHSLNVSVTEDFESFQFSQALEKLRVFTWDDLADWYLEVSKFEKSGAKEAVLKYVTANLLKLWHPFIPFVTEVIWQELAGEGILMVAKWPTSNSEVGMNNFDKVIDIVTAIRNARAENQVEPAKKVQAIINAGKANAFIETQLPLIKNLKTGIEEIKLTESREKIQDAIYIAIGEIEIQLVGAIDKDKEADRIRKEISEKQKFAQALQDKLANKEFIKNAPEKIVASEREKLASALSALEKLKEKLS